MEKLKLLIASCALLLGAGNANAQTDVTSTYITNADFSLSTPIDNHLCGYGKDMEGAGTTYYGLQDVTGWKKVVLQGAEADGYSNNGMGGAEFAYGSEYQMKGNNATAPAENPNGETTGNALGFFGVWGNGGYYYQDVTLPAGSYTITVPTYCYSGTQANTSYIGFIADGASYLGVTNTTVGEWVNQTINFTLFTETSGKIALGYLSTGSGSGANPHLFFDKVSLSYSSEISYPVDMTGYISNWDFLNCTNGNFPSWIISNPNGGNAWKNGNTAVEYWIGTAANGSFDYYQTINNLPAGKYTISASMWNSTNGVAGDAVNGNAGVYGTSSSTTVFAGVTDDIDNNGLKTYTTEQINVIDGTLRVGVKNNGTMGARWFGVDWIKLTLVAAPDLSDFVEAYETALANANAVDQSATMAASIKSALNSAISTYGSVDKTSISAMTEATEALNNATAAANTSIASYAVIAAGSISDESLSGWVCENTNTFHINTWSVEGNSDGSNMKTPFIENWVGKGSYLGAGKVYYQLSGLEPGEVYYAQALVRSYNEASSDAPNGPNFFVNDETVDMTEEGTTFTYNDMSGIYATLGVQATIGVDGILKLGVEIAEDRNYNWVAFKSVKIQELSAAYNEAVANAEALEGKISATAYSALETAISAYSDVTIENISSINSLVATYSALVNPYAAFNALKEKANTLKDVANDNSSANSELTSAISAQTTAAENATNVDGINTATSTLKTAMVTYVGDANPVGDGAKFDCTFMLTNPDLSGFPAWQKPIEGWYTDQTFDSQNFQTMNEDTKMFMEYWSGANNATNGYVLYQQLTLEPGTYKMEAECKAGWGSQATDPSGMQAITFSAGETDGTSITSTTLDDASIEFVQSASGVVKIGLKAHTGNTCNWMGIGYVELYKVPAKVYEISENAAWDYSQSGAGDVTLTRTIAANYNTVVFPFSMTQAEVEDKFGEDSKVYVISAFADDNITFAVQEGIQANKPCLLKATEAGTSYTLEGRTIVSAASAAPSFDVDGISMVGNYNASFTVPQDEHSYIVSGDALYLVNSADTVKNTCAYFVTDGGNNARSIRMSFDGVTGIATVENGAVKAVETGDIYDLSGRKVKKPSKGIYLMNGKKFVF